MASATSSAACRRPRRTGPFTVEQHVADAVAVLDELGVDRAVVLGHSWGGHLALHLAVAHPGRVAGLVIVDPLGAVGDGGVGEMGAELASRLSPSALVQLEAVNARLATPAARDADALASLRLLWPGYFAEPAAAPPLPDGMRISLACYEGTFGSVTGHLDAGFGGRLKEITAPAVFVLGERSPMPVAQGEQTAALLPGAEVRVVPGAGHLPWHERPGCVADAAGWVRAADVRLIPLDIRLPPRGRVTDRCPQCGGTSGAETRHDSTRPDRS